MASARILVVDDDSFIVAGLTQILEAEGYSVAGYTDPLKAAEERNFEVVLTDFVMPGMNGIELLGVFKHTVPDAVRLLLTAHSDFKVALVAVNEGEVFRLLPKPWAYEELITAVRQAVDHQRLRAENERLSKQLKRNNDELVTLNRQLEHLVFERTRGLLLGMVSALDHRDSETQWHSRRVSLCARRVATQAGISGNTLDLIEQGALLHDIGKIGVRDSILLKPGPLTPEEWDEMRLHPEMGYRMLADIPYLKDASLIVLQHQERWDGRGYPQGLKGDGIVIGARVFAIVDAMDAITSDRPYRRASPLSVAKSEIARCKGTQFDPVLVDAYLSISDDDWAKIRAEVDAMAADDLARWERESLGNFKRMTLPPIVAG